MLSTHLRQSCYRFSYISSTPSSSSSSSSSFLSKSFALVQQPTTTTTTATIISPLSSSYIFLNVRMARVMPRLSQSPRPVSVPPKSPSPSSSSSQSPSPSQPPSQLQQSTKDTNSSGASGKKTIISLWKYLNLTQQLILISGTLLVFSPVLYFAFFFNYQPFIPTNNDDTSTTTTTTTTTNIINVNDINNSNSNSNSNNNNLDKEKEKEKEKENINQIQKIRNLINLYFVRPGSPSEYTIRKLITVLQNLDISRMLYSSRDLTHFPDLQKNMTEIDTERFWSGIADVDVSKIGIAPKISLEECMRFKQNELQEVKFFMNHVSKFAISALPPFEQVSYEAASKYLEFFVLNTDILEEIRIVVGFRDKHIRSDCISLVIIPLGYKQYLLRPGLNADGTSNLEEWSIETKNTFNYTTALFTDALTECKKFIKYFQLRRQALQNRPKYTLKPYAYQFLDSRFLRTDQKVLSHYQYYHPQELEAALKFQQEKEKEITIHTQPQPQPMIENLSSPSSSSSSLPSSIEQPTKTKEENIQEKINFVKKKREQEKIHHTITPIMNST